MSKEIIVVQPVLELMKPKLDGLEKSKSDQIIATFAPMTQMISSFEDDCKSIFAEYETQKEGEVSKEIVERAKKTRLAISKVRIETEKKRKAEKEEYVRAGKAIDGVAHIIEWAVKDKEDKLKEIETHFDRIEEEKRKAKEEERREKIIQYDPTAANLNFSNMEDVVFDAFLEAKKLAWEKQQEDLKKEEEARIKREEEERIRKEQEAKRQKEIEEELEKQKAENARLAEEARIREEEIAKKEEAERKEREEKEEQERKEREAAALLLKQKEEAEQAERDRIKSELEAKQKELDAIKEAERKAEEERIAKEKADAEEKEKERLKQIEDEKAKAKLPEKKRISDWIESFSLPKLSGKESETSKQIEELFEKFKQRAIKLNEDS
jgi:hypothetical protein